MLFKGIVAPHYIGLKVIWSVLMSLSTVALVHRINLTSVLIYFLVLTVVLQSICVACNSLILPS
jgi:hypothetical protein